MRVALLLDADPPVDEDASILELGELLWNELELVPNRFDVADVGRDGFFRGPCTELSLPDDLDLRVQRLSVSRSRRVKAR